MNVLQKTASIDVSNIISGNGSSVSSTVSQEVQSKSMSVSTNSSYTPNIVVSGSRLTVVSCKAKEEAASSAPTDSRLTRMSIIQEQEL